MVRIILVSECDVNILNMWKRIELVSYGMGFYDASAHLVSSERAHWNWEPVSC